MPDDVPVLRQAAHGPGVVLLVGAFNLQVALRGDAVLMGKRQHRGANQLIANGQERGLGDVPVCLAAAPLPTQARMRELAPSSGGGLIVANRSGLGADGGAPPMLASPMLHT